MTNHRAQHRCDILITCLVLAGAVAAIAATAFLVSAILWLLGRWTAGILGLT